MAKLLLVAVVALACLSFASAAVVTCTQTRTELINSTATGQFGCLGTNSNVQVTWILSPDVSRTIDWSLSGYSDSRLAFYTNGGLMYGPFSPSDRGSYFFPNGMNVTVVYNAGQTTQTSYGMTLNIAAAPNVATLTSSQTLFVNSTQEGGFIYFALPYQKLGAIFSLDVEVFSYQGLREPSVFVSRNAMPTLEKYDYTNTTVSRGDHETALIFINSPPDASYLVGVFLYGTAASLTVNAQWLYKLPYLQSGVKVSQTFNGVVNYQCNVPVGASKLVFQISRQVPGGFPIAYIAIGVVPTQAYYQWVANTNVQSYISITIPNPNPVGASGANPGNYIFSLVSTVQSGFIIQADWV